MTRKRILHSLLVFVLIGSAACSTNNKMTHWESPEQPFNEMQKLREQIKAPQFKDKDYVITDFGAVGDGKTKDTEAFRKAIEECNKNGGGRVVVPFGTFLTGPIHLKSNVNLHLADSTTILFSRDYEDYLPLVFTRWEGMELMNYSPFIYAYEQENIAITGNGTLDGNASNEYWWSWKGQEAYGWKEGMPNQAKARDVLHKQNHEQVDPRERKFGTGHYLRPNFIQPYNCKNVLIADVKMINSPMWNINPVLCENVIVERVKIITLGPNNDGCDPESCKNVLIKDCYFDTGDDCIAIKSGRDEDGRRIARPAENHIIENCQMKEGHGGVVIGSEISGGARNIYAIGNTMDSPNLDRVLRIKTSSSRGGIIENIYLKDTKVGTYKEAAVKFNMFYEQPGEFMPTIRNVWVENMDVEKGGEFGLLSNAYKESPVTNVRMINVNIKGVEVPVKVDYIEDLKLENVRINGELVEVPDSLKK